MTTTADTAAANATEPGFSPEWLRLREAADGAARAAELLEPLRRHLAARRRPGVPLVIRDLGCGTGSMGRWLAPRLPGPQHWVLHDHDPALLALAARQLPTEAADGSPVTVATAPGDVADVTVDDLAGTDLVAASALLDLLTREEVDGLAAACTAAGTAVLFALSVAGRVELTPAEPLDVVLTEAFNDHQRRTVAGRRLLGPDAVEAACDSFAAHGAEVHTADSPWRLDADAAALTAEWLTGWVGAAVDQRPELSAAADTYLTARQKTCAAGDLAAVVQHGDLLALPPAAPDGAAT